MRRLARPSDVQSDPAIPFKKGERFSLRWDPGTSGTIVEPGREVSGCILDEQPDKYARYYPNGSFVTERKEAPIKRLRLEDAPIKRLRL